MENNLDSFSDFRNQLRNKKKYNNGDESFLGLVIYNVDGEISKESLKVNLLMTTPGYGKVSLEEGEVINSNNFHLDFYPDYQTYTLTPQGFLEIVGHSEKMGNYKVQIIEI